MSNATKVKLPASHPSTVKVARSQVGKKLGSPVTGFGGGKPHASTMGGAAGHAPHKPGGAVSGFSGAGLLPGKV